MTEQIGRTFLRSSVLNVLMAAFNFSTTILLVRWFGSETYSSYIVDLSIISLVLLMIELVPSNYSVFRMQEDEKWQGVLATFTVASMVGVALLVFMAGMLGGIFKAYSFWMVGYAAALSSKRYLDILLQSSGRLTEFLQIELAAAFFRLVALCSLLMAGNTGSTEVWASLAISVVLAQLQWSVRNSHELVPFFGVMRLDSWLGMLARWRDFRGYYFGIALKRVKDNAVPLVADRILGSAEALSAFFLAQRGLVFALGQVRILESLLNHRGALKAASSLSLSKKYILGAAVQSACIATSAGLFVASGLSAPPWQVAIALSFCVWPILFYVMDRAEAYSSFDPARVNRSLLGYLLILVLGGWLMGWVGSSSAIVFALLVVLAEFSALVFIKMRKEVVNAEAN